MKGKFFQTILPFLGYILVRMIHVTCRSRYNLSLVTPSTPVLVAFWHGELLMEPFLYQKGRKGHRVAAMISTHGDGELIARLIGYFGFSTVRGSSRRGGAKALVSALRAIDDGCDIAITPDGPKGPRYSIADGIVVISQKKDIPIVPFSYTASRYWQLSSWDKFVIPKPFSTITYTMGDPFFVTDLSIDEAKKVVNERLLRGVG